MLAGVVGVGQEVRAKLEQALLEKSELRLVHVFLVGCLQKILFAKFPQLLDLFRRTLRRHDLGPGALGANAFGRDDLGHYTFGCHAITFLQRGFLRTSTTRRSQHQTPYYISNGGVQASVRASADTAGGVRRTRRIM